MPPVPRPLSQFALQFLGAPAAARQQLSVPVLVWEAAPDADAGDEEVETRAPSVVSQPRVGDPLVFEVAKTNSRSTFATAVTVGRDDFNDVVIKHGSASRLHAWFQRDARTGGWKLLDAESTNGTWLDSARLPPKQPQPLPSRAQINFGHVQMLFLEPPQFFEYIDRMMTAGRR